MAPAAGYTPLDLENSIGSGQWRTIEEHERLQQEGPTSSSTSEEVTDFYRQQRQGQVQHSRRTLVWAAGGLFLIALVVVVVALTVVPHSSQPKAAPAQDSSQQDSSHHDTGQTRGSGVDERGSRSSSSDAHPSSTPQGLWHEGGGDTASGAGQHSQQTLEDFIPCKGPNLQCAVVNKQPIPQADFRNLPRRATAAAGMVASDNSRCGQIGRDVLRAGGNAVDSAVATALCLGVVNPVSSGLGGGAFITVRLANGTSAFYDARETAPAAATEDMFTGLAANASLFGGLAVAVPGELPGLEAVWKRFGSGAVPWAQLVSPAADLARSGFAVHPYLVYILSGKANLQRMQAVKSLREVFLIRAPGRGWRAPRVGELCCKRPQLAATLDKIAAHGASYLSSPAVAAAHAQELSAAGGIITAQDLAAAQPLERELLRVQLGEVELLVPPPPSSAAVVAFVLKFLAGYGNTLQSRQTSGSSSSSGGSTGSSGGGTAAEAVQQAGVGVGVGPGASAVLASFGANPQGDKAQGMHRLVEALKHGFAIRTALGDPGSQEGGAYEAAGSIAAAVGDLVNDTFIDALRDITRDDTVLDDSLYGGRWNPKGVSPPEEHGTSHFCVVDAERNAVSMTTSINTPFGSGVMSDSSGILFGNTMDDFSSPARSTIVTPHPTKANFIAPGRRPLSAMSPIIAVHKATGRLVAVAGASGGPLIVSATAQTLARLLLEGADVHHAVGSPRLHDQLVPMNSSFYENYTFGYTHHQMSLAVVKQLQARDQPTAAADRSIGVSQAIYVDYADSSSSSSKGVLMAASDSRKDGAPVGYD